MAMAGSLYLQPEIAKKIDKLVIFEVAAGVAPHSVTQIVNNSNKERISVSGWYN